VRGHGSAGAFQEDRSHAESVGVLVRLRQQFGERKIDLGTDPNPFLPLPRMVVEKGVRL